MSDDSTPRVGVVTALGRPEYELLAEAGRSLFGLQQLLAAEGGNLEWIVCLDRLPPTAVKEVHKHVDLPVTVVRNAGTSGPGPARNRALERIRAQWLLTVDSDDTIVPTGMLALIHALEATPGTAWAAGRCYHVDPYGKLLWKGPDDPFVEGIVRPGAFWQAKLDQGGLPFLCTATVASTAAVREVGGWPEGPRARAEDTALWAVLTSHFPGVWVAEHVYDYRRHQDSVTHQTGFRQIDEGLDEITQMIAVRSTKLRQRVDHVICPNDL
jgi:glycosyltransferase involved in cell wall biosynthesis